MANLGPLSGKQVANKYHLGELLGSSGMAAVYKAQDTGKRLSDGTGSLLVDSEFYWCLFCKDSQ